MLTAAHVVGGTHTILLMGEKVKPSCELCPQEIVSHHLRDVSSVSGSYRVVDEEPSQEPSPSGYIEAPYHVVQEDKED